MKKPQQILLIITGVFICLLAGIFIGRNLTGAYVPIDKITETGSENPIGETAEHDGRVDINTATLQQLQLLPGVGETIAQRILDYRTKHGAFTSINDLLNVNGIGSNKLEQMKPYIKVIDAN